MKVLTKCVLKTKTNYFMKFKCLFSRYTRESGGASKMSRKRLSLPLAGRSGVKRSTSTAGQEGGAEILEGDCWV